MGIIKENKLIGRSLSGKPKGRDMKKLLFVVIAVLILLVGVVTVASATQATCPDGGNWVKFNVNALEYLYEAPEGMVIKNTCYKAGSNPPVYDGPFNPGLLEYLFQSEILNPQGNAFLEISHASVELWPEETPTPTEVPPTPTETEVPPTPTETEVPPTDEPTATPTEVPIPVKPECPDCGAPVREIFEPGNIRILKGQLEKCVVVKIGKEWKICFGQKNFKTYDSDQPFTLYNPETENLLKPEAHEGVDGVTYYHLTIFQTHKDYGPMIILGPDGLGDDGLFQDEDRFEGESKAWVICSAWPIYADTTADGYGVIRPGHTPSDWFEFLWEEGLFGDLTRTEAWNWALDTITGLRPGDTFMLP